MRYRLQAKTLNGGTVVPKGGPGFQLSKPSWVTRDPGRDWAGDLYETDAPTDPAEAYAHFTGDPVDTDHGPEDVEAWLDRGDDGMLIGWVRQGNRVWRYIDPELWGLDVDGADMTLQHTNDDKVAADMADVLDSHAAGDEVDALDDTDPDMVTAEADAMVDELADAVEEAEQGAEQAPDGPETDEPTDDQAPDETAAAATDLPDEEASSNGDTADESSDEDDEDTPPWVKGGKSKMQKKTLRLVVHPKG